MLSWARLNEFGGCADWEQRFRARAEPHEAEHLRRATSSGTPFRRSGKIIGISGLWRAGGYPRREIGRCPLFLPQSFIDLMDQGQIDVVQVDLTRCGGFTEAMKIASLAADRGLPVVNHGFTTYINVAAALHFLNSVSNSFICEFVAEEETTLRDRITKQRIVAADGMLAIPDAPGLGIDLNEAAVERYLVS